MVAQLLGRPVPTPGATTTINLLETGELFPGQLRTVDVRFTKLVRVGRSRTDIGVDIYNIFNSNHPTGYVQAFDYLSNGATWLRPTSILGARFVRLNATLQF